MITMTTATTTAMTGPATTQAWTPSHFRGSTKMDNKANTTTHGSNHPSRYSYSDTCSVTCSNTYPINGVINGSINGPINGIVFAHQCGVAGEAHDAAWPSLSSSSTKHVQMRCGTPSKKTNVCGGTTRAAASHEHSCDHSSSTADETVSVSSSGSSAGSSPTPPPPTTSTSTLTSFRTQVTSTPLSFASMGSWKEHVINAPAVSVPPFSPQYYTPAAIYPATNVQMVLPHGAFVASPQSINVRRPKSNSKDMRKARVNQAPAATTTTTTTNPGAHVTTSHGDSTSRRRSHKSKDRKQQYHPSKNGASSRSRRRSRRQCHSQFVPRPHVLAPEPCFSLDCEMVGIAGDRSMVTRVTLLNLAGAVVMDVTLFPDQEILDYRSHVSGMSKEYLAQHATMTLSQCRDLLHGILYNPNTKRYALLVGHALENDLQCLGMTFYPPHRIRDTAKYEPFQQYLPYRGACRTYDHAGNGNTANVVNSMYGPRKLKALAKQYLHVSIQAPHKPHCPKEDAWAALQLYLLVQVDWEDRMRQHTSMQG